MLRKARIAVFVSGSGTNLQALIDSDEIKSGELCLVVSNKADAYALKRAEAAGIRGEVLPSKGTEFDNVFVPFANNGAIPDRKAFYVACTRSSHSLYISYSNTLTNFMSKVNKHNIEMVDTTKPVELPF